MFTIGLAPMIRFITHSTNLIADELVNAHLIARHDEVIQGEITFDDGVILAQSAEHTSFALCLQCDVGKAGRLILQTSVLPPRAVPDRSRWSARWRRAHGDGHV